MKRGVKFMYHSEDSVLSDATGSQSPTDLEASSGFVQLWSRGSVLALVPKFAGSNPAEAVGFLRAQEYSARLPSEGK
jgi:hypothetical protein